MKFSEISIESLRGVGNVELTLDPAQRVFTLFGANGVGKTKCLEALFQYCLFFNKTFLDVTASEALKVDSIVMEKVDDHQGRLFPRHEVMKKGYVNISSLTSGGLINPINPFLHDLPVVFLGASQRATIEKKPSSIGAIGNFPARKKASMQTIMEALNNHQLASLGMTGGVRAWIIARAQSVNPYQKSEDNRQVEIDALLKLLHEVDDRIDQKFLQIDGSNQVFVKIEGETRELGQLSSGFTSVLKLMQAIISGYAGFTNEVNLTHVRGIVLIDEIESHLHLEWQSKIVLLLKKMLPNTTFFIATHSPLVLTQLDEGEAYQLKRDMTDGVVHSHRITAPNKQALIDILREGFGVDMNVLKRERMSADSQAAAKKRLLDLLKSSGADL